MISKSMLSPYLIGTSYAHLIEHFAKQLRGELMEIVLPRAYEEACDIRSSGGHSQMVFPTAEIMVRANLMAQHHEAAVFALAHICEHIEPRLRLAIHHRGAVHQTVEQLCEGLGGIGLEGIYSTAEAGEMVELRNSSTAFCRGSRPLGMA